MKQIDKRRGSSYPPELIFYALIVGVQGFMAFNGGATSATIDSIEEGDTTWTPAGIGLLGAMDKLGMTVSSPLCGFLFQLWPAKMLLATGLFINASACLIFGSLRHHSAMFAAKLLIGVTEGLQWVWAPQWIDAWAGVDPQDLAPGENADGRKQMWMNLNSAIVAGVGAGLGIVVAGLGTANGLSYCFAFKIEAGALFMLWLLLLTVPRENFSLHREHVEDDILASMSDNSMSPLAAGDSYPRTPEARCGLPKGVSKGLKSMMPSLHPKKSVAEQISELWQNQLFCRCAVAFANVNFVVAGMQFLWVRLYTGLWHVSKTSAVISQLVIVAAGGGTGVALSSTVAFSDSPRGKQRLAFTTKAFLLASLGAAIAATGALMQLLMHESSMVTLAVAYIGVFVTAMGLNMTPGLLQIICMETVEDDDTRTLGTGVYQGLNNFFGLAMGPFLPQLAMNTFCTIFGLDTSDGSDPKSSLVVGFICALCGVCVSLLLSATAWNIADDETETQWESVE